MNVEPAAPQLSVHAALPTGREVIAGELRLIRRAGYQAPMMRFAYAESYLADTDRYELSPDLPLASGPLFVHDGLTAFGAFADAMPDQWGRHLLQAQSRARAAAEGRPWAPLDEMGLLAGVADSTRQGALRVRPPGSPAFVAEDTRGAAGVVELPRLIRAAGRFQAGEPTDDDLGVLVDVGSSAGGARPKVTVTTASGRLGLAKLPSIHDRGDVAAWEAACLSMANRCGITTPGFVLHRVAESSSVLVLDRFDRTPTGGRIGYLSAASLTMQRPGEVLDYVTLASMLAEAGNKPSEDLPQLFRRIAFTLLVNNVDDHMRNHGVLRAEDGWRLSPVFDVNPGMFLAAGVQSTPINSRDDPQNRDIRILIDAHDDFRLTKGQALLAVEEVVAGTAGWAEEARRQGASEDAVRVAAATFENPNRERARSVTPSGRRMRTKSPMTAHARDRAVGPPVTRDQ